jgi:hypothetical protein
MQYELLPVRRLLTWRHAARGTHQVPVYIDRSLVEAVHHLPRRARITPP